MEYLKLIGILIIVVGFALKWDVIAVVLISGLVTGSGVRPELLFRFWRSWARRLSIIA